MSKAVALFGRVAPVLVVVMTGMPTATKAQHFDGSLYDVLSWSNVGIARGGRSTAVAGSEARPFEYYFGAAAGSGKVLKVSGKPQYFISQRAQHIHEKTSSSTTSSRSIINTRDEPHADAEKYRRLHIIVGDSNMSEYATYLKVGTAALVLCMIEDGFTVSGMELEDPVKAIREISRDPTLPPMARAGF